MDVFSGRITATGFSNGNRIVVGDWAESHLGSFTNIMWAKPDGTRLLLSPSHKHANYVSKLYSFEEVRVADIEVSRGHREISVRADELDLWMRWGYAIPLPVWRPLWFISMIEGPLARLLYGVSTHGNTKDGRKEWYSVRGISRVLKARASLRGEDFGRMGRFRTDACFGFSEPPSRPSSVSLRAYIE
ncbi:MAG: hypothetical protein QF911_02715 [Candidatus Thalassarchaeaceae archaeon]|nr:hypothetical protein [Candidatus Thalassarchaeaceae archaeon]